MNKMPKNVWQALGLAWELGFIIAIPLVVFGSIGKYADGQLGTTPWLTLAGVFLAMATTVLWLYRQFKTLTEFKNLSPGLTRLGRENAKGKNSSQNSELP